MGVDEPAVARPAIDLVAREAVVAEGDFVLGQGCLYVAFQPAMMLHALGQGVADEHDAIAFLEFQLRRARGEREEGAQSSDEEFLHKVKSEWVVCHARRIPSSALFAVYLQFVDAPEFARATVGSLSCVVVLGRETLLIASH